MKKKTTQKIAHWWKNFKIKYRRKRENHKYMTAHFPGATFIGLLLLNNYCNSIFILATDKEWLLQLFISKAWTNDNVLSLASVSWKW
jgi:hypothetical protein